MSDDKKCFAVSIKIKTETYQEYKLNKDYYKANRLYNNVVRYVKNKIKDIEKTKQYKNIVALLKDKNASEKKKKELYKEIREIIKYNNLTQYDLEKYAKIGNLKAFEKSLMSQMVQVLVSELYKSIEGYFFKGTKIRYRKFGHTNTLSSKTANCTILFNRNSNSFRYQKMLFKLKDIRDKDYYLKEALDNEVVLCKIVRKAIKNKYVYYLQIVLRGLPPKKIVRGTGNLGIDQGTSTIAYYKDDLIGFIELAPDIKKYNKEIAKLQRELSRKMYFNNIENYNDDGTIKKGSKMYRSNNYMKTLFKLKDVYRRKTAYVQEEHNKLTNFLLSNCDTIIKETLDFKALQKRTKGKAVRQNKKSTVKDKNGNKKQVYKFKRKKRYGKSLNNHSPGYLNSQIIKKAEEIGVKIIPVDMKKFRASQYCHDTDTYVKSELSERFKIIDGEKVQRDLYSSFLMYNYKDEKTIDRDKCINEFPNFIEQQNELIKQVTDNTRNFGLKYFI